MFKPVLVCLALLPPMTLLMVGCEEAKSHSTMQEAVEKQGFEEIP